MKTLGQSTSTQERQLEAAVRSIDSWQGRRVGYAPVSGGISNTNWRVEVEGADTAYFSRCRARARRCSSIATPLTKPA